MEKRIARVASATRTPLRLLRLAWNGLFRGLEFQKDIVAPVVEKLIVALMIFVVLATCKQWIYPLLWPQPSDPTYPIHAIGEAFADPGTGVVEGEIYLINLTRRSLSSDQQREWLKQHSGVNPREPDARITVEWSRESGRMTIEDDTAFNSGKGQLELSEPTGEDTKWRITIQDINGGAVLRLKIKTDYVAALTRDDNLGLPFEIAGPRSIPY